METNYLCPECRSLLNIGEKIVLSVRLESKQNGLLLFEKLLGNYTVKKQDLLHYREGELVEFYCPICHENLQSDIHPNLARLILIDDDETEYEIIFSRIAGEHATYKIKDKLIESFGDHKSVYLSLMK
jgi:hypothetical protein